MIAPETRYSSENCLLEDFRSVLESNESPWGHVQLATEFFYIRGRTDVVAVDDSGDVLAFELKLSKWRDALDQAFRNTCFANRSYVVFPEPTAKRAQRFTGEFARRRVGICYVKDGNVVVVLPATHQVPIQPWLSQAAASKVRRDNNNG